MSRHKELHHIQCKCQTEEHTIVFAYDPQEGELYVSTYLNDYRTWYHRVWVGLKYIFGYACKYGHWDTTLLDDLELSRLKELCDRAIAERLLHPDNTYEKN